MTHTVRLAGCAPVPLAHYLKALGILRLVAEQCDKNATGRWENDRFVLESGLDGQGLTRFFLEDYRPTPILSPWNGRAGYLEGEKGEDSTRTGARLLSKFRKNKAPRLAFYSELIAELDRFAALKEMNSVRARKKTLGKHHEEELKELGKKEAQIKRELFTLIRNTLPEHLLIWIDACIALGEETFFAPLLGGSGGVERSMDIGVNFMQNLEEIMDVTTGLPTEQSNHWLDVSLFGTTGRIDVTNTAGSLAPGNLGGANATTGFGRGLAINPWDFILMLEGAVVFQPSVTRKFGTSGQENLSYPFCVDPTTTGAGGLAFLDQKKVRSGKSEVWVPLWSKPASHLEIKAIFREGRITADKRGRLAKTGLDCAAAIASLGVDRGLSSFQRFVFLARSGDNDIAVEAGRFHVKSNPNAGLLHNLQSFLDRLRAFARSDNTPNRIRSLTKRLEDTLFVVASRKDARREIQQTLMLLGELQSALCTGQIALIASDKKRAAVPPVPVLSETWVQAADDGSPEFRIAAALAGLYDKDLPMRVHLAPVAVDGHDWNPQSRLAVWGGGSLVPNLIAVLERRLLEAERLELDDKPLKGHAAADAAAVSALLLRRIDDTRTAALLQGLALAKLPWKLPRRETTDALPLPAAYLVLKPFFTPDALLHRLKLLAPDARLPLPAQLVVWLRTNQVDKALKLAWQRARIGGLDFPGFPSKPPSGKGLDGRRLLAALMAPLDLRDLNLQLRRVYSRNDQVVSESA